MLDRRHLQRALADLLLVEQAGRGAVDVTVGSGLRYHDFVAWNHRSGED